MQEPLFHEFKSNYILPIQEKQKVDDLRMRTLVLSKNMYNGVCIGLFDEAGKWKTITFQDSRQMKDYCHRYGIQVCENYTVGMIRGVRLHMVYMRSALLSMKEGMTVFDLAQRYNMLLDSGGDYDSFHKWFGGKRHTDTYGGYDLKPSTETKKFITKMNTPSIERYTENPDPETFDLVRIYLGIKSSMPRNEQAAFIRSHLNEIVSIAKARINRSRRYQKFGVPPEYLRLDVVTITAQSELCLVFILPELGRQEGEACHAEGT